MIMENQTENISEATRSAETPTKVYCLTIDQTRTYYMTVAAESAEQARAAWEATGLEYSARFQPEYEWNDEVCSEVTETDHKKGEIEFESVCEALDFPYEEEEED
jgi:hypothetical protein